MDNLVYHEFRSVAFGGFNRQDVSDYIESSAKAANQRIQELSAENDDLNAKNDQLSGIIHDMEAKLTAATAELETVCAEKVSLECKNAELGAMLLELEEKLSKAKARTCVEQSAPLPPSPPEASQPQPKPVSENTSVRSLMDFVRRNPSKSEANQEPEPQPEPEPESQPEPEPESEPKPEPEPEPEPQPESESEPSPPSGKPLADVVFETPKDSEILATIKIYYPKG